MNDDFIKSILSCSKEEETNECKCTCCEDSENGAVEECNISCDLGPLTPTQQAQKSFRIRKNAAKFQKSLPIPSHPCNGDEYIYANKIGNFTKAMPHNELGEVELRAYNIWTKALTTGNPEIFEEVPLGGDRKFANPQGAFAYNLVGPNSHHLTMPPAPEFSSARAACEMAEDYWRALTRDVPFNEYDESYIISEACEDMSKFSDYDGPKYQGKVTPNLIFRGNTKGDIVGPIISQFLYKSIPYGYKLISQKYPTAISGRDYMTSYDEWLSIQNGDYSKYEDKFDPQPRFIRNGRDLATWVHGDFPYQSVLNACLILLSFGKDAYDSENPYLYSKTQDAFVTFGPPHVLDFITKATRLAFEAAWFQKFLVHRRLRPEAFGGCVHNRLTGNVYYPINKELLKSSVLSKVYSKHGTYLLPMAYPEGSPTHPAYPAGHATVVGAGVTILKAFFNEEYIIPKTVMATNDGLALMHYTDEQLTIGGELDKLASNISHGRDTAGVHWRTDGVDGMKLGESVAIGMLHDYKETYNEKFTGFSLTKFDGTKIII